MPCRMKAIRRERGLSQMQLAWLVGLTPQDVSAMETGRRRLPGWTRRVAQKLGVVDPATLFDEVAEDEHVHA